MEKRALVLEYTIGAGMSIERYRQSEREKTGGRGGHNSP